MHVGMIQKPEPMNEMMCGMAAKQRHVVQFCSVGGVVVFSTSLCNKVKQVLEPASASRDDVHTAAVRLRTKKKKKTTRAS